MKYSIIVPVYNRPDEVDELLSSLCSQALKDFEVIIVEDGSQKPCKDVCDKYADILDLHYYSKENSGPGQSRNYGVERARGKWVIILDSDVVLPEGYLSEIEKGEMRVENYDYLARPDSCARSNHNSQSSTPNSQSSTPNSQSSTPNSQFVAWGGPDRAHASFTPVQKAISYAMTSFFTTGGIRGGKKKLDKFYPRSFNMGIRRDVYQQLGGFSKMRFGEDIDFSYRIVEAGYEPQLLEEAWVWHKRRTDLRKFFRQVYNSGIARINLEKRHPGTLKLVHLLPAVFTVGVGALLLLFVVGLLTSSFAPSMESKILGQRICQLALLPLVLYAMIIGIDSSVANRSLKVGLLSIPAAFVQLTGYGMGFIESWWKRCVLKKDEFQAFEKNFYN